MILLTQEIEQKPFQTNPYQWAYYENTIEKIYLDQLSQTFPTEGFDLCQSLRADKSYKMYHRLAFDSRLSNNIITSDLSTVWIDFLNELISPSYIKTLSKCTSLNLCNLDIEINFWKYGRGGWLSPHTDKVDKVASQLFYFNTSWQESWGGAFRILKSNNIDDIYKEVFPGNGNSIALIRCDSSWHAVSNQTSPNNIFRQALQLIFWKQVEN